MTLTKDELKQRAEQCFDANKGVTTLHVTGDGQCFADEHKARNHQKWLGENWQDIAVFHRAADGSTTETSLDAEPKGEPVDAPASPGGRADGNMIASEEGAGTESNGTAAAQENALAADAVTSEVDTTGSNAGGADATGDGGEGSNDVAATATESNNGRRNRRG